MELLESELPIARIQIANALAAVNAPRDGADIFLKRARKELSYDDTGTLCFRGQMLESAFQCDPNLTAPYRSPGVVTMGKTAFKEACRAGVQFQDMSKIKITDDPPVPEKAPSKTCMTRAEYKQAMIDGVQGLNDVVEFLD